MATFWERAARSVNRILSLYYVSLQLWLFPIWLRGRDLVSDCSGSWSLLTFILFASGRRSYRKTLSSYRETSQVLLAGVSGGFPGVLPFRPTYRLARLDMSEIFLKGTLN